MIRRHFFLVAAGAVLVLMLLLGAFRLLAGEKGLEGGEGGGGGGRAPTVSQVVATQRPFADRIEVLGVAKGRQSVTITSDATEMVTAVRFRDGQAVSRGQVLVELKANEQDAGVQEARARVNQAQRDYERWNTLAQRGFAPKAQVEQYRAALETARATLNAAQARKLDRLIRAPFSGVVGLSDIAPGALISPGSPIVTLDDVSVIRVDFDVPDRYLSLLQPGAPITARPDALPDTVLHGRVAELDTRINTNTRAITARAEFPNAGRLIRPGMMIRVGLEHGARIGVAIPESAIQYEGDQAYVFVIGQGPRGLSVKKRPVVAGLNDGGFVEIRSGLRMGEGVVADGLNRVQDGQPVKVAGARPAPAQNKAG
ncbi:MAG TPA: efflux RND transporter periplasmic adaptor subunit [Caulobacteraceae bacterium]|nr:efflux RND transporter periplasmic adaptor subunit [Caulobacteraceae bacterium]